MSKVVTSLLLKTTVTTTNYLGGYQYQGGGAATPTLQFFPTAEGYYKQKTGNTIGVGNYVFNYTDHLGNVRLSYEKDATTGSLKILEESNYYPFGMKHSGYNSVVTSTSASYKYKYNGKELQDELGLNMYDMDARQYDPAIARWVVQDPIVHHDVSPYVAFNNNPVYFSDPDCMDPVTSTVKRTTITSAIDADGNTTVTMRKYSTTTVTNDDGSKTVTNSLSITNNVINNTEGDKNNIQYSSSSSVSTQTNSYNSKGELTTQGAITKKTEALKYDSDNGVFRAWTNHIADYNRSNGSQQTWNDKAIKDGSSLTKSALAFGPALLLGRIGAGSFPGGQKGKGTAAVGVFELLDWSSKKIDSNNKQLILSNQDKVNGSPFNFHRNPQEVSNAKPIVKTMTVFDRVKNMLGF